MIEQSYGGQNRKYRFVHFPQTFSYLFVYIRNRLLEELHYENYENDKKKKKTHYSED